MIAQRSKVELVVPSKIHPNPWNKNRMGVQYFAALKSNMANPLVGFTQPILVQPHPDIENEWQIVDGEHRWKASKELGLERVPVINLTTLPEAVAKYIMIESNAIHGATSDEDVKKILSDLENDPIFEDFDVFASTATEKIDDETDYGMDEDEMDNATNETVHLSLYFSAEQLAKYRQVVGQMRLARGITAEAAVMECIEFFEDSTGMGDPTGDEDLDSRDGNDTPQADYLDKKVKRKKKSEVMG